MKKYISIILAAAFALTSCNTVSPYTTDPCKITVTIADGTPTASYVLVDIVTEGDISYYYANVITAEEFAKATNQQRFMQLCLDTEYMEYINWRYSLLVDNEEYVPDFSSHSLYYGSDSRYFKGLNAKTDYVLYAFCVNPETNQPVGDLQYVKFTTREIQRSSITFQAMFKTREDGSYVSIIPSNDNEHYLWTWEDIGYLEESGVTAKEYLDMLVADVKEYGLTDYLYVKGPQTFIGDEGVDLIEGHKYVMMAAGYDGDMTTDMFTCNFDYPFTEEGPIDLKVEN